MFNLSESCPIAEFPHYLIDYSGNIYSIRANLQLKPVISVDLAGFRYKRVSLYDKGKRFDTHVHRLVCETFIDADAIVVDFINRDTLNTHMSNLRSTTWANDRYNMKGKRMIFPALPKNIHFDRNWWRVMIERGDKRAYSKYFNRDQLYEAYLDVERVRPLIAQQHSSNAYFLHNYFQ